MVIENEIPQFFQWLPWAVLMWFVVGLAFAVVGVGISFLFAVIGQGPQAGLRSAGLRLKEGTLDLLSISPRRVYALSVLSVQEAVRRKVFVVFGLFVLVLLFGAWFLDPADGTKPAKMFLVFVFFWMTVLSLLVGLFLSVFSLPKDISNHTIFTVVTKPVRPAEIVLGRIFGFTAICSVMLLAMGILSFVFVNRTLEHEHEILGSSLRRKIDQQGDPYFEGKTTSTQNHTHDVRIEISSTSNKTDVVNEHFHRIREVDQPESGEISGSKLISGGSGDGKAVITAVGNGLEDGDIIRIARTEGESGRRDAWVVEDCKDDSFVLKDSQGRADIESYIGRRWRKVHYLVGPAEDFIKARVSIHASELQFRDRDGNFGEGINVGDEWVYRKFIEGDSQAVGLFRFEGMKRSMFPEGIKNVNLEMTLAVFRTRKGEIESAIPGQVRIGSPEGDDLNGPWRWSIAIPFQTNEEQTLPLKIPVSLKGSVEGIEQLSDYSFPESFVNKNGDLWVEIKCVGSNKRLYKAQFLGMAKHDVYFVASRASPSFNFMKGCFSIWLQMVLVVSIGVMFSTFLNGFIGLLATLATILGSYSVAFIRSLTNPDVVGGASFESAVKVFRRDPMVIDLDPNSISTDVILWLDSGVQRFLWLILQGLPDMSLLSSVNYVSQGFNIPLNNLCYQFFVVLGFLIPLCLLGHYVLKGRELAK